ncbi:MAG: hypothetical protein EBU84_17025, partial [Actinobacteria bacterium]|nr:hypothetical protein [Actinomycetota bacterium]
MSVHEAVKIWKEKVGAAKSEASAINTVLAGLASHGYAHKPSVGTARQEGVNFRLYHWADTPFGDLILVTGPSVESQLLIASELLSALRKGCLEMRLVPVTCGASFKNRGVQPMLDAILAFLPSPLDKPPVEGKDLKDHDKVLTRKCGFDEPFSALAFKIMNDPFVGQLTYFRVYSGQVESGAMVYNSAKGKRERLGRLLQ